MSRMFDSQSITVPCPSCSRKHEKTIAWIRSNKLLKCAGCGQDIQLDTAKFKRQLDDMERQIKNIFK